MAAAEEIEAPHKLASLPKPVDPVNGKIQSSSVWNLRGQRKRKRCETAVSVDGEGIYIHSIRSSRLLSSYTVSPQTVFTTRPCSIWRKNGDEQPTRRYTYATIRSFQKPHGELVCFAEELGRKPTTHRILETFSTALSRSDIEKIDVLPSFPNTDPDEGDHYVLLLYRDGELVCLSKDLKSKEWSVKLSNISPSNEGVGIRRDDIIEYSLLASSRSASKGLLKAREDVVEGLAPDFDTITDVKGHNTFLCLITRFGTPSAPEKRTRRLHVLSITTPRIGSSVRHKFPVRHILCVSLPKVENQIFNLTNQPIYSLDPESGILHQHMSGSIITYDLTGTVPRLQSELRSSASSFSSFVRLAPNLIVASSGSSCGVYDTRFSSLQGSMSCVSGTTQKMTIGKRKQSDTGSIQSDVILLDYFAEIGLVVGLHAHELVGLNCGTFTTDRKRRKTRGGVLLDSLGKGLQLQLQTDLLHFPSLREGGKVQSVQSLSDALGNHWASYVKELDQHVAKANTEGFEKTFGREVGVLRDVAARDRRLGTSKRPKNEPTESVNSAKEAKTTNKWADEESHELEGSPSLPEWQISHRVLDEERQKHRRKALYALGKIFSWKENDPNDDGSQDEKQAPSLEIKFLPPNIWRWLVSLGYVSLGNVEQALRQIRGYPAGARKILPADWIRAITDYDPEMRILHSILSQPSILSISEIVQAIKTLIQSLDNTPPPQLTETSINPASNHHDEQHQLDSQLDFEEAAAHSDLDLALSTLDEGLAVRSQTLRQALTQLHAFSPQQISQNLRTELTPHEIIFLIQILRIELADGGWTSRYGDIGPHISEVGSPSDRAIALVADLLSCAIDAVGAGGWVSGAAGNADDSPDDLLLALRGEISAALEGIHEASFMKGLFSDFLKYAWRCKKAENERKSRGYKGRKPLKRTPYSLPVGPVASEHGKVLPMGLKAHDRVMESKVQTSGEVQKRTKRDIGEELSKRVGEYSFEKIKI